MTSSGIELCLLFISGKEEREKRGRASCLVGYRAVVVRDRLARDVGGFALLVVRLAPVGAELCGVGDGCDVRHMVKHVACDVVSQLVARLVCLGVNVGAIAVAATVPRINAVAAAPAMRFIGILDCLRSVSSSVFVGIVLYSVMIPGLMFGACAGASSAAAARASRDTRSPSRA